MANHFFRRRKIRVKTDRRKHCLHRIGQNRRPSETAALQLAGTQIQTVADIHFQRDFSQHAFIYQSRAHPRQLAFRQFWKRVKQHPRHGIVQNRIADKFKTLIVFGIVAAVGQSLLKQLHIAELIAQTLLNRSMRLLFEQIRFHSILSKNSRKARLIRSETK